MWVIYRPPRALSASTNSNKWQIWRGGVKGERGKEDKRILEEEEQREPGKKKRGREEKDGQEIRARK